MAINLPTDGMDSLGALIQLQMLEQMRPSVQAQPMIQTMSRPDLPIDTGTTANTPQGIAGVLARYAENRLEEKQQPIRMETGGSIMDQLYGQLMGQVPMGQNPASYNYDYEYTPYVAGAAPAPTQSAVADVPDAPLAYGPEDIAIRESGFDFDDGGISGSAATGTSGVGAPSAAQTAANQSFAQAVSSPIASQVFGPSVGRGVQAVSGLASMMGVPGIGLAGKSPIGIMASLVGLVNPVLGLGLAGFGRGVNAISGLNVQTSPTGQTQVSGVGNETVDMFGNVIGTPAHTANMLGYSPTDPMNSKINFSYQTVADVDPAEVAAQQAVADFAQAHQGEVGNAGSGGGMSSDDAATNSAESGNADGTGGGHMAQGGVVDFYAQGGGISSLAYGGEAAPVGFANKAFEGVVPGQGTGMSDDVPFSIEGNQPALLSRDEYVLPADVVSQLGDGSSGAGADMLDDFIDQVRNNKYGNTNQPPPNGQGLIGALQSMV